MCAGQQESIYGQDAGTARSVSSPGLYREAGHAGRHALHDMHDSGRVGAQCFGIVGHTETNNWRGCDAPDIRQRRRVFAQAHLVDTGSRAIRYMAQQAHILPSAA